jgi:hypothetical protein
MSLYRQTGGRSSRLLVGVLVAGVLVGLAAGYLIGRGSVDEPSAAEVVADARAELQPVAAGLELVPIEYEGAWSDGKVTAPTEYKGAKEAVARAQADLAEAGEDMRAIDPAGYAAATEAVERLSAALTATAPPDKVEELATRASSAVESLASSE